MEECVFCKIIVGEIPSEKVFENDSFIVILDINPISEGHVLIIPKEHYETILDMPDELGTALVGLVKKIGGDWISQKNSNGFNLIQSNFKSAQQEIPHLHFHIIPRSEDDGLKLKFK